MFSTTRFNSLSLLFVLSTCALSAVIDMSTIGITTLSTITTQIQIPITTSTVVNEAGRVVEVDVYEELVDAELYILESTAEVAYDNAPPPPPIPSPVVLVPGVHPGTNLSDYRNLNVQSQVSFYYQESATSPSGNNQQALVGFGFNYPVVPLEHSSYISSVVCVGTTISISFTDSTSFNIAVTWPSSGFVLAGAGYSGCGNSADSRFWGLVSDFIPNGASLIIDATISYLSVQEVASDFDISFGGGSEQTSGSATPTSASVTGQPTTAGASSSKGSVPINSASPVPRSERSSGSITSLEDQDNFDINMENSLGSLDPKAADFHSTLPGFDKSTVDQNHLSSRNILAGRSVLVKRGFFSFFSNLVNAVVNAVKTVINAVVKAVESLIPPVTITPIDTVIPIDLEASRYLDGPKNTIFGDGYTIISDGGIALYCLECAFIAPLAVRGKITASLVKGVTVATLSVNGPMHFGFNVALVAEYSWKKAYEKQLGQIPLSPFTIPEIITLGPELAFGMGLELGFDAKGGIAAGVDIDWNDVAVLVDAVNPSSSNFNGLVPSRTSHQLQMKGQVQVTGEVYLSVGLDFGLDILNGFFKVSAGLVDKPGIELDVTLADEFSAKRDTISAPHFGAMSRNPRHEARALLLDKRQSTCKGIDANLYFKNELDVKLTATGLTPKVYPLNKYTAGIFDTCYSFVQSKTSSSSDGPSSTQTSPSMARISTNSSSTHTSSPSLSSLSSSKSSSRSSSTLPSSTTFMTVTSRNSSSSPVSTGITTSSSATTNSTSTTRFSSSSSTRGTSNSSTISWSPITPAHPHQI